MNKCIFSGRICNDLELKQTQGGTAVLSYRLAIPRRAKQDGQPDADFVTVIAFGKAAEFAYAYFKKGMRVEVVSRVQTRSYDSRDGHKVSVTEFIAEEQNFGEKKSDESGSTSEAGAGTPYVPDQAYAGATAPVSFDDIGENDNLPF